MKTYLVGIFPFDDTVDIIRESWLCGYNDELEQLCQFPAVHGDKKKLEDLLNTCEFPDDAWPKYVIVPKRTGIGKKYCCITFTYLLISIRCRRICAVS